MKILVAEDDPDTRTALAAILEAQGWEVVARADGRAALAAFEAGGFDLLCLDIMMPGLSGYDVCRAVRARDRQVPVLFVSAKSEEIDTVLGLELGADDYIVKPFGARELEARVRALLRRAQGGEPVPAAASETPFRFGAWSVDPGALRARAGAAAVELSPRELGLLRLLAAQPGRVVRREEFFKVCWALERMPLSRTLDQHIARLRKKIDLPGQPSPIRTVQGVGYRYEPDGAGEPCQ